jgi:TonB family protein
MFAESIVVAGSIAMLAAQQPAQKYADGQEMRVCGSVVTARANSSTCETTLRVSSAGEEFDVFVPAALQKQMTTDPQRLRGAEACFTGKVTLPGRATLPGNMAIQGNVARITAAQAEVTAMPPGPAFGEGAVLPCGGAITLPQVVKETKPQYTTTAMRAGIQGTVEVEAVVDIDGNISDARVFRPLHAELDEQALNAVREWKFVPGVMDGKPVPVLVTIELTFTTRSRKE